MLGDVEWVRGASADTSARRVRTHKAREGAADGGDGRVRFVSELSTVRGSYPWRLGTVPIVPSYLAALRVSCPEFGHGALRIAPLSVSSLRRATR